MKPPYMKQIDATCWEIPRTGAMRVPGRIFADAALAEQMGREKVTVQVANVACLPGIVGYAMAMPDAHWGYGFPIGGVAATDPDQEGVVSPGGVGYDINCGCRLMTTRLDRADVAGKLEAIVQQLFRDVPCGVGSEGAIARLSGKDMAAVLERGARWAVAQGYGTKADLEATEDQGCLAGADPTAVSKRAMQRGEKQLGTLGSGNHFAELGAVDRIYDAEAARCYGLTEGQITVMIHSGSRGLGYQVCDDYLQTMQRAAPKYAIKLPDRQLCCAPVHSPEGRRYLGAMAAAANYAWANRQIIMVLVQRGLERALGMTPADLGARLVYDVCHNIAKFEMHAVDGHEKRLCVHRKGATRAFPGSRAETPAAYRAAGQPVLVPGSMGSASYVCAGKPPALEISFGSCCHGAGRVLSRSAAKRQHQSAALLADLASKQIHVVARSNKTLVEEAPQAYKDVDAVAEVVERAGLSARVARIVPLGVIKG